VSDADIVVTLMTRPDLQLTSNTDGVETTLCSVGLSDADSVDPERLRHYSVMTLNSVSDPPTCL
jgi:hypothetical protein